MSVNIGEDGKRSVQVEIEVPGSPEEVWQAIATGPGVSSWFVPTEIEGRVGGSFTANFGPGMESVSTISQWDPPRSFVKDGDAMSPDAPPVATEWIVEAKAGGTCIVRVVHSWFASTDDWDSQWESVEQGWNAFFNILRLKLQRFSGESAAAFDVSAMFKGTEAEAWEALTAPLGLTGAVEGQEIHPIDGPPNFAGKVEIVGRGAEKETLLLLHEPEPGICHLSATAWGEQIYLSMRFYLFGDNATAAASKAEPEWSGWFGERFPTESSGESV